MLYSSSSFPTPLWCSTHSQPSSSQEWSANVSKQRYALSFNTYPHTMSHAKECHSIPRRSPFLTSESFSNPSFCSKSAAAKHRQKTQGTEFELPPPLKGNGEEKIRKRKREEGQSDSPRCFSQDNRRNRGLPSRNGAGRDIQEEDVAPRLFKEGEVEKRAKREGDAGVSELETEKKKKQPPPQPREEGSPQDAAGDVWIHSPEKRRVSSHHLSTTNPTRIPFFLPPLPAGLFLSSQRERRNIFEPLSPLFHTGTSSRPFSVSHPASSASRHPKLPPPSSQDAKGEGLGRSFLASSSPPLMRRNAVHHRHRPPGCRGRTGQGSTQEVPSRYPSSGSLVEGARGKGPPRPLSVPSTRDRKGKEAMKETSDRKHLTEEIKQDPAGEGKTKNGPENKKEEDTCHPAGGEEVTHEKEVEKKRNEKVEENEIRRELLEIKIALQQLGKWMEYYASTIRRQQHYKRKEEKEQCRRRKRNEVEGNEEESTEEAAKQKDCPTTAVFTLQRSASPMWRQGIPSWSTQRLSSSPPTTYTREEDRSRRHTIRTSLPAEGGETQQAKKRDASCFPITSVLSIPPGVSSSSHATPPPVLRVASLPSSPEAFLLGAPREAPHFSIPSCSPLSLCLAPGFSTPPRLPPSSPTPPSGENGAPNVQNENTAREETAREMLQIEKTKHWQTSPKTTATTRGELKDEGASRVATASLSPAAARRRPIPWSIQNVPQEVGCELAASCSWEDTHHLLPPLTASESEIPPADIFIGDSPARKEKSMWYSSQNKTPTMLYHELYETQGFDEDDVLFL